jgi:hypothetical protein
MKALLAFIIPIVLALLMVVPVINAQAPTPFPTPTIAAPTGSSSFAINLDLSSISPTFALISTALGYMDAITNDVNLTTTLPISLTISESNPLSLARGFAFILSDVTWLQILFGWFTTAFLIVLFVTMARLVVSIWGIVERIISLIKLIPGI